jgi:hypothetical protein
MIVRKFPEWNFPPCDLLMVGEVRNLLLAGV